MRASQRIIMGIDPGTNPLGFGVILVDANSVHLVDMGVVDLRKIKDHFTKLEHILRETGELMDKYAPDDIAIEAPFYGKNPQVMLKLGRAQGAAISAALSRQIPVYEYAPRKIKMAITGKGAASKEQVKAMVERTMDVKLDIKHLDASDAVAIAMCHFYQLSNPLKEEGAPTNWKQYVEMHSDRVKKS